MTVIQWVVCVPGECWGAFDDSADDQAHVPFTEEVARGVAAGVGPSATAVPLTEIVQPGV